MLNAALEDDGKHMALIALWDGKGGDGSGGTEHMVKITYEEHADTNLKICWGENKPGQH
jgi:hypothetical protein